MPIAGTNFPYSSSAHAAGRGGATAFWEITGCNWYLLFHMPPWAVPRMKMVGQRATCYAVP